MKYILIWWIGGNIITVDPIAYPTDALCQEALAIVVVEHLGDPTFHGACHLKTSPEE